jgi:hypothetical protein
MNCSKRESTAASKARGKSTPVELEETQLNR